ncbi:hypothetical protein DPMN_012900 [Dreissena polymorpha]|uniref:Uncharacterized protein n=1 Tax=Dreissena polymorpha TaxID=45954 RepID=A0A9D4N3B0_DREPO|nr:hypothetical protein DPMN_012900 [Dreissena polymorpha]
MLHMKFKEDVYKLFTDGRTDGRRTLSDHNSSPRAIAQLSSDNHLCKQEGLKGSNIIGTNFLAKFHEDWKTHVAFREKCPAPGSHVFQPTSIIFKLVQDIKWMNLLTHFHEDRTINVTLRVKNAPPLGSHTNLLTKFHEDWTINVASRVLTSKCFELISPANMSLETKFQCNPSKHFKDMALDGRKDGRTEGWTTPKQYPSAAPPLFPDDRNINVTSRVLTRKNSPPPCGGHIFQPTGIIFELVQDIIGINLLTEFHEDPTTNVASRVLTRFYYSHIRKNAPPLGSHVFQANVTIFELI